jgi:tetratricopeptide (TPR) repeat protein
LAAALWGLALDEAHQQLKRLVHVGVLTRHEAGHHTMDVEVRAALERTAATVLLPGCRRARSRVVSYYTDQAIAADLVLDPGRWRWHPPAVEQIRHTRSRVAGLEEAQAWLDDELDNLVAVVELAHHTCHHQQVILIVEAISSSEGVAHRPAALRRILELGLASAEGSGDEGAQAVMHQAMAAHHLRRDDTEQALACAQYALALWASAAPRRRRPYHERGLVHLYLLLAQAHDQADDVLSAARYTDLAKSVNATYDHPRDTALVSYHQARALHTDERFQDAASLLRSALRPLAQAGEQVWVARVHRALCEVGMDLEQYTAAREYGQAALDELSPQVAPLVCAHVHESLAWVAHKLGESARVRDHFEQARAYSACAAPGYARQMMAARDELAPAPGGHLWP